MIEEQVIERLPVFFLLITKIEKLICIKSRISYLCLFSFTFTKKRDYEDFLIDVNYYNLFFCFIPTKQYKYYVRQLHKFIL